MSSTVRPGREIPQWERGIVNVLIDQGWTYTPRTRLGHSKITPPDPNKRAVTMPSTTVNAARRGKFLSQLRKSGAVFDEKIIERVKLADRRRRNAKVQDGPIQAVESDLRAITTHGAWWRPATPEPVPVPRPAPPPVDHWAEGRAGGLIEGRQMLFEGYHINAVVRRTGWGLNHFAHLVDESGYIPT